MKDDQIATFAAIKGMATKYGKTNKAFSTLKSPIASFWFEFRMAASGRIKPPAYRQRKVITLKYFRDRCSVFQHGRRDGATGAKAIGLDKISRLLGCAEHRSMAICVPDVDQTKTDGREEREDSSGFFRQIYRGRGRRAGTQSFMMRDDGASPFDNY